MFAIRVNGAVTCARYQTFDEAVEAAQEDHRLPQDANWQVIAV